MMTRSADKEDNPDCGCYAESVGFKETICLTNPVHGIDLLEIFMNRAGMALEMALLKKRLAKPLKEKK